MTAPTEDRVERLRRAFHLDTPIIALYDAPAADFAPRIQARGRACCFAYYERWLEGKTLVISKAAAAESFTAPRSGCPGMQRAFGLVGEYPPWMAHFLTDGEGGAPMGEGLKATPELAQAWLDRARPPAPRHDTLLLGPLRLDRWERIESLTFFVDPDRFAGLLLLATYWSADPGEAVAPFSSGCGLLGRELKMFDRDRVIIGGTDIAMRKYLPPSILCLTVSPARFARMTCFPDRAFPNREWWRDLMASREKEAGSP